MAPRRAVLYFAQERHDAAFVAAHLHADMKVVAGSDQTLFHLHTAHSASMAADAFLAQQGFRPDLRPAQLSRR